MKHREFAKLCDGAALYVWPATWGIIIAKGGVANRTHWVLGLGEEFHMLSTRNLTEKRFPAGVTWFADDGTPAYSIYELQACEEINEREARALIQASLDEYHTRPEAVRWLRQAIRGASFAWPDAVIWHKPGPQTGEASFAGPG